MALFRKSEGDPDLPKGDRGRGSFDDYDYNLSPKNKRVTITLAGSDPCQDELRAIVESGELEAETAISPRTIEQERVDADIPVRLFTGRRVSGVVGTIPRGLESVVDETLRRLDDRGEKVRIPARVTGKPGVWRVELLMGVLKTK
jgi:hypothetical protein